jgi:hypothetical protein
VTNVPRSRRPEGSAAAGFGQETSRSRCAASGRSADGGDPDQPRQVPRALDRPGAGALQRQEGAAHAVLLCTRAARCCARDQQEAQAVAEHRLQGDLVLGRPEGVGKNAAHPPSRSGVRMRESSS